MKLASREKKKIQEEERKSDGKLNVESERIYIFSDPTNTVPNQTVTNLKRYADFDKKELVFLTENRPARRFLYFRFLITYLNAKKSENTAFTSTVEGRDQFWASPGEYLEKSTLKALARNISGLELPPTLLQHTFEHAPKDELAADYVGISLSSLLRDATVESTKELEAEDPFDEDEEENDD
ncbi:hypothetical protein DTO280E4_6302 [Paecilomyces variotii]|nr:hypothetical protein DTO280E4_6302 [Paecilomyces variotii]